MNKQVDITKDAQVDTTFVYFDIETIPSDSPELLNRIKKNLSPPAAMKKQETIEKWWAEQADDVANGKLGKTSFDGGRGQICVISFYINDLQTLFFQSGDFVTERDMIAGFFGALPKSNVTLVGHNITTFDIPFITKRAICLGVKLPNPWVWPRSPRPYGNNKGICDTMLDWDSQRDKWTSMDELCDILGIEGKTGMDGSQVAAEWAAGNCEKVAAYCADDVERTRKIHQYFLKAGY